MLKTIQVKIWKHKIKRLRKKKQLSKKQLKKMINLHVELDLYDIEKRRKENERKDIQSNTRGADIRKIKNVVKFRNKRNKKRANR